MTETKLRRFKKHISVGSPLNIVDGTPECSHERRSFPSLWGETQRSTTCPSAIAANRGASILTSPHRQLSTSSLRRTRLPPRLTEDRTDPKDIEEFTKAQ